MSAVAPIAAPPALPGSPRNTQEFLALVATKFHCMQGPPRAYFEIPTGLPPSVWGDSSRNFHFIRGAYTSLRLASWARREDCERRLFAKLWEIIQAAHREFMGAYGEDAQPLLFWRTMPHIHEEPPTIPGEEVGGYSTSPREFYRTHLFARLWIPGAPQLATLDSSRTQESIYV